MRVRVHVSLLRGVYAGERDAGKANSAWYRDNRMRATTLFREGGIRVKPAVRCLVEAWWAREILGDPSGSGGLSGSGGDGGGGGGGGGGGESAGGGNAAAAAAPKVIGVHLRGTDKRNAVGGRVIEPKEHFAYVDAFLSEHGAGALVFVATDSDKFLEKMKRRYGERIRHYEVRNGAGSSKPFIFFFFSTRITHP